MINDNDMQFVLKTRCFKTLGLKANIEVYFWIHAV